MSADLYRPYFELVENKSHWKDPIDTIIELPTMGSVEEMNMIYKAVEFFTSTTPKFTFISHDVFTNLVYWKVTADGYRMGPAGDH